MMEVDDEHERGGEDRVETKDTSRKQMASHDTEEEEEEEELVIVPRRKKILQADSSDDDVAAKEDREQEDAKASEADDEDDIVPVRKNRRGRVQARAETDENEEKESGEKEEDSTKNERKRKRGLRVRDSDDDDEDTSKNDKDEEMNESEAENAEEGKEAVIDAKEARRRELAEMAERARKVEEEKQDKDREKKKKSKKDRDGKSRKRDRGEDGDGHKSKRREEKERRRKEKKDKKRSKDKGKSSKESKKDSSSSKEQEEERVKQLLTRQLNVIISTAVIENDMSLSKKMCREKLMKEFGEECVTMHKAYILEEVSRIVTLCSEMDKDAVPAYAEGFEPVTEYDVLPIQELVFKQVRYILLKAVTEGDDTLSKRGCREKLAEVFGAEFIEAMREQVDSEVRDRLSEYTSMSAEEAQEAFTECKPVEVRHLVGRTLSAEPNKEESDEKSDTESASSSFAENSESESAAGSVDSSDSEFAAKKKKKRRSGGRGGGVLGGAVCVLAGKALVDDKKKAARITSLIEEIGGKVQSMVTHKVSYVVVDADQKSISGNDTRIKSARKHGAKVVLTTFLNACKSAGSIPSWADFVADIRGGTQNAEPAAKKKSSDNDAAMQESDDLNEGEEREARPKAKRVVVRKTKDELDFMREYQARFSFVKDAKKRPYNPKEVIVPDSTFFTEDGTTYNIYLTQADTGDGEEVEPDKFYALKLVEAGGMMKGDKWHLVTQWGKVGTEKPGCDVIDYNDLREAKEEFAKRFWEKTRNPWEAGAVAFRAVSGRYVLVEMSDDEEEGSDEDETMGQ